MIVAEAGDRIQFTTQPAHADLAGQFADRWGTDRFDAPPVSTRIAAYHHDSGWRAHDDRPHVHADGSPVDFREADAETWVSLYERGIDHVVDLDPYAGLLVSLHGAGLRRRRYGLSPSWESPPAYDAFLDREEQRQSRLADQLHEAGRLTDRDRTHLRQLHETGDGTDAVGGQLWADYKRLQAWDSLSLALCMAVDPPALDAVGAVPTAEGDEDVRLTLAGVDDGVCVDPYPFETAPLAVSVATRTVDRAAFEAAPLEAYYGATRELKTIRLRE